MDPHLAFALAFAAFALLHSLTAATGFKKRVKPYFGDRYRLAYTVFSILILAPAFYLYVKYSPGSPLLFVAPPMLHVPILVLRVLTIAAIFSSIYQQGLLSFVGLKTGEASGLVTTGPYGLVRHPIYFFGILFIWLNPVFTAMDLLAALLATAYFVVGAWHEDRRLLTEFGDEYEDYRKKVPMLVPGPQRTRSRRR
jgi:protein-S-isoprenylcysteine O-methyltransferase Ste14